MFPMIVVNVSSASFGADAQHACLQDSSPSQSNSRASIAVFPEPEQSPDSTRIRKEGI
jgi:hypothetical protein